MQKVPRLSTPQLYTFRLTYRLHDEQVSVEFSQPKVLIGRNTQCDLVLNVASVSRRHASIERDEEGWQLSDLGSSYGTFVDDRRVTRYRLSPGDKIVLGLGEAILAFEPLDEEPEQEVVFSKEDGADNIRMSISVEDFERAMGGPRELDDESEPEARVAVDAETRIDEPPVAPAADDLPNRPDGDLPNRLDGDLPNRPDGVSMIGLFKQIGEVLLGSEDLDDMLSSVVDIALNNLPAQRGFICLCDETAEAITPKAMKTKGSAADQPINISRSIAREAIRARQALLVSNAPTDSRFARAPSIMLMDIRSAMCAPLYHAGKVEGLIYVDTLGSGTLFLPRDLQLLTALGVLTAVGMLQARLRDDVNRERAIRARLSRYSSPHVVEQIVARVNTPDGAMLAEQCEVSVLFADLSGFTSMSEGMEPAEVARLLNSVFDHLTRTVFQYDGTLDKYLGDGLLAIFGAPLPQADHAQQAVRAAMQMQQLFDQGVIGGPQNKPLRMRIGINSGTAVAGDIGSPIRKDYTVIGDVVNVASRLESSVARPGQIVIGPATYELCKDAFKCQPLPEIQLKGKQQLVRPYLVLRD